MVAVDELLRTLIACDASDLHLRVGEPPVMRLHGELRRIEDCVPLTDQDIQAMISPILNEEQEVRFSQSMEMDLAYSVPGAGRFRVNLFRQHGHIGAVMHVVPSRIRTLDDLMIPSVVKQLCHLPRGLILVTGPTGTGKSTTLAAMVNYINETQCKHIITIEDPIEFVHLDRHSAIEQREVGSDTHSFAAALKHIMRQNPDVILVGEMRDLETMHLAITAAETGHLVFGTLHTIDAPQTVDRIIDVFEPDQQQQIRMQLSITLQAVISQTLLPRSDGTGRIAAFEVMVVTPAIRNLIRENRTHQIYTEIMTGGFFGMQTMDTSLLQLVHQGLVDYDQAKLKSHAPEEFEMRYLKAMERRSVV